MTQRGPHIGACSRDVLAQCQASDSSVAGTQLPCDATLAFAESPAWKKVPKLKLQHFQIADQCVFEFAAFHTPCHGHPHPETRSGQ